MRYFISTDKARTKVNRCNSQLDNSLGQRDSHSFIKPNAATHSSCYSPTCSNVCLLHHIRLITFYRFCHINYTVCSKVTTLGLPPSITFLLVGSFYPLIISAIVDFPDTLGTYNATITP